MPQFGIRHNRAVGALFGVAASAVVGCLGLLASLSVNSSVAFAETAGLVDVTGRPVRLASAPAFESGLASTYGETMVSRAI